MIINLDKLDRLVDTQPSYLSFLYPSYLISLIIPCDAGVAPKYASRCRNQIAHVCVYVCLDLHNVSCTLRDCPGKVPFNNVLFNLWLGVETLLRWAGNECLVRYELYSAPNPSLVSFRMRLEFLGILFLSSSISSLPSLFSQVEFSS